MDQKENNLKSQKIETYTEDMVRAIEGDRTGLIKKIINEEEMHEAEKRNLSPDSRRNKLFVLVGTLLMALSIAVIVFLTFFNKKISTVEVTPQYSSYIFSDKSGFKSIQDLNKQMVTNLINNTVNSTTVKQGGVESFYLTKNSAIVGLSDFLSFWEANVYIEDIKQVFNDNFLMGVYNGNESKDFFVLMRSKSFQNAFKIMRAWEGKMVYDFADLFDLSLSPETSYLFSKDFEDSIVANKNARILYKEDESIALMYVFVDEDFVIITDSLEATNELMARLFSSEIKK